jgi:hypothetical protein
VQLERLTGGREWPELLTRIRERDFENFIYEVVISIQFVQGLFEHFRLKIKIHPYRTIKAYQPGMDRNIGVYCPFLALSSLSHSASINFIHSRLDFACL